MKSLIFHRDDLIWNRFGPNTCLTSSFGVYAVQKEQVNAIGRSKESCFEAGAGRTTCWLARLRLGLRRGWTEDTMFFVSEWIFVLGTIWISTWSCSERVTTSSKVTPIDRSSSTPSALSCPADILFSFSTGTVAPERFNFDGRFGELGRRALGRCPRTIFIFEIQMVFDWNVIIEAGAFCLQNSINCSRGA
jgi:hypothetical protein